MATDFYYTMYYLQYYGTNIPHPWRISSFVVCLCCVCVYFNICQTLNVLHGFFKVRRGAGEQLDSAGEFLEYEFFTNAALILPGEISKSNIASLIIYSHMAERNTGQYSMQKPELWRCLEGQTMQNAFKLQISLGRQKSAEGTHSKVVSQK